MLLLFSSVFDWSDLLEFVCQNHLAKNTSFCQLSSALILWRIKTSADTKDLVEMKIAGPCFMLSYLCDSLADTLEQSRRLDKNARHDKYFLPTENYEKPKNIPKTSAEDDSFVASASLGKTTS